MVGDKVAGEVVREALRLLEQQDEVYQARLEQLRKDQPEKNNGFQTRLPRDPSVR